MEKYSQEKALKEAEELQALIKEDQASSYSEAEAISNLIERKERPLGEYKKDAGHYYEEMMNELAEEIPGVQKSFLSSEYDDKKAAGKKVDVIVCFFGGGKLALQVTGSESKEKQMEKLEELKKYPILTELHDDKGNVILKENIPRAIASCDSAIWKKALNKALAKGLTNKTEALPNKRLEAMKVVKGILASLEVSKGYRRDYPDIFEKTINNLEKSLKELERQ